jgi:hypothetical protein
MVVVIPGGNLTDAVAPGEQGVRTATLSDGRVSGQRAAIQ